MSDAPRNAYDAEIHDNQIVAMYDTEAQAVAAQEILKANGFPESCMRVLAQGKVLKDLAPAAAPAPQSQGVLAAIASLFVPTDERTPFQTVITRGHAMLVVTPDRTMDRRHIVHLLEATHPFDFDARAEEWRAAGTSLAPDHAPDMTDTGYRNAAQTTEGSPAALAAEIRYREGQREMPEGANRVRSYIADRPGASSSKPGAEPAATGKPV